MKPAVSIDTGTVFGSPLLGRSVEADIVEGFIDDGFEGATATARDVWTYGRNDLQAAAEEASPEVAQAAEALHAVFGNSRMTGSGSAVFARVAREAGPEAGELAGLRPGWKGRMCRSLGSHPLAGWAE